MLLRVINVISAIRNQGKFLFAGNVLYNGLGFHFAVNGYWLGNIESKPY